jgi:hypothetical protein
MDFTNSDLLITLGMLCSTQAVVSAIFLVLIGIAYRQSAKTRNWSSVMGKVTSSMMEERSDNEGGTTSYPVVVYRYSAGGQTYENDKIAPGLQWGGTGAGRVVARYPAGSSVTVYYDPQNPSVSILERSAKSSITIYAVILVIISLFICGLGVFFAYTI